MIRIIMMKYNGRGGHTSLVPATLSALCCFAKIVEKCHISGPARRTIAFLSTSFLPLETTFPSRCRKLGTVCKLNSVLCFYLRKQTGWKLDIVVRCFYIFFLFVSKQQYKTKDNHNHRKHTMACWEHERLWTEIHKLHLQGSCIKNVKAMQSWDKMSSSMLKY